jgi:serine/threonine-protein kinase
MGQVWLAVRADGLYERRVAIKLLRPGLGDMGLHARFTRERQILARLGHAHIARLLDAGISADGQPYLALDYVRGEPITDYAEKLGLDVRTRLQLFLQVCAAVSHAHAEPGRAPRPQAFQHPGDQRGRGLPARLRHRQAARPGPVQAGEITRTGARAFTLHYAAPEQLRGEVITTMTDVYALGVVLYELLTDCSPTNSSAPPTRPGKRRSSTPSRRSPRSWRCASAKESESLAERRRARALSGDLDNIILKTLSKEPEQRYASVEALAQDIRRYLDGQPVQARAQSFGYRARKYLRRHAVGLGIGFGRHHRARGGAGDRVLAGQPRGEGSLARAGDAGLRDRAV